MVVCRRFTMQTLSMVVMSCGASVGVAFAPLSKSNCVSTDSKSFRRCSVRGPVPGWIQRLHEYAQPRNESSRRLLFSPGRDDPVLVVRKEKPQRNTFAITESGVKVKAVSQRTEQDQVLGKLEERDGLRVRTGRGDDMMRVARLCVDTFRGPFEWWMVPLRLYRELAFYGQIGQRCGGILRNEIKHCIVVVEDTRSREIVGFLEVGMLPRPTSSEEFALQGVKATKESPRVSGNERVTDGGGALGSGDDGSEVGTIAFEKSPDVAYLANVVVDRNQRRRGIGRLMINAAIEMVRELWPMETRIYVTVEKGNDVAIAVYEALDFELTALEDDMLARSRKRPTRIYFSKSLV